VDVAGVYFPGLADPALVLTIEGGPAAVRRLAADAWKSIGHKIERP
jgi:hypothetical protein